MSLLLNESHANNTTPLWASAGSGGGGSNYPIIPVTFSDPGGISLSALQSSVVGVIPIPAQIQPGDNILFSTVIEINVDTSVNTNNLFGNLKFTAEFSDDDGTKQGYTNLSVFQYTPDGISTPGLNFIQLTLIAPVGNNPSDISILVDNITNDQVAINSFVSSNGYIQKLGTGIA